MCMHSACMYNYLYIHCINKIVKITNSLVNTDASCYGYTCNYNPIIVISIFLYCLIDVETSRINILIESLYVSKPALCI